MNTLLRVGQCETTFAGRFLAMLYYKTNVMDLVKGNYSGFPHDGGIHSLTFHINKEFTFADVEAFLSIIESQYGVVPGCCDFVFNVRAEMFRLCEKLGLPRDYGFRQ